MAPNNRQRKTGKSSRSITNVEKRKDSHYALMISQFMYISLCMVLAGAITISHRTFLATLFENDRHFSHLSTLERELAFRTEMGFYFSYFKTIISAESVYDGLFQVMNDNITEYPSTINTLKRFNLYPELIVGWAYRIYISTSDFLGHRTKICWTVNRGEGLSPVQSCEGLGEPAYFYVEAAFLLNGLMLGIFFLFGTFLSKSIFGGLITVACFMFNHGEATRVMWTPPLRESFGYPFFVLHMFVVSYILRNKITSYLFALLIGGIQICFMLSWQFAQFALLTQTLAVTAVYLLQYISIETFKVFLKGQTVGLLSSFVLLFGNEMLLTSFFASTLLAAWVLVVGNPFFTRFKNQLAIFFWQSGTFVIGTLVLKLFIGKMLILEDDAHIGEILKSKFTSFKNFHTMLYTCAKEFDFIEQETIWKLLQTLVLPSAVFAFVAVAFHLLRNEIQFFKESKGTSSESTTQTKHSVVQKEKEDAELVYHSLQLLAFTAMALLIMRLKLFWTPHLCLYTSLLASKHIFPFGSKEKHYALLAVLVACMAWTGVDNLQVQLGRVGEFSNIPMEELVEWIKAKTPQDAVFAGAMPTMATVKLCTLRPIVNHPHYEDAGLRERTKLVYSIYSRKPLSQVKANLDKLGVQYIIIEDMWCSYKAKTGCSLPEIWDLEDKQYQGSQAACHRIKKNPESYFQLVFKNNIYHVFQLLSS
ncbi:C-mannosyltransferase DPY19L1 [Biomphalaria glabrata]|uniref:Probable C-mannosyltransferase DPY19L1 isoform X1 n=2 Tax=Biomphalaria glabrata TaxID=6526 RepID=A0A9U8EGH7_BIOGL|nr:probable C-mannosyltransferase DPY19L1 isoform X1 [Biomphalaria glabrata]KAI8755167.1 putative C-mannosyltransferase DPY19L1 [Biomphalaria glabrata]KAI8792670.1 C-mannosyltransferase DPY19L1 [Biomphalaria glabrata]